MERVHGDFSTLGVYGAAARDKKKIMSKMVSMMKLEERFLELINKFKSTNGHRELTFFNLELISRITVGFFGMQCHRSLRI